MLEKIKRLLGISTPFENLLGEAFRQSLKNTPKSVLIDVRSRQEFKREKIPNAMNLDLFSPTFNERVRHLDPQKTYFLYCQSGMRSKRACKRMYKQGITKLINLKGGIRNYEGKTV